jgi:hypothetical protein
MTITKTRTWIIATFFSAVVTIASLSGPAAALAAMACRSRTGC